MKETALLIAIAIVMVVMVAINIVQPVTSQTVAADITRVTTRIADGEVTASHHLTAVAEMTADSLALTVRDASRVIVELAWRDSVVRESVWREPTQQYRKREYISESPYGADDIDHPLGCMFGVLTTSWLVPGNPYAATIDAAEDTYFVDGDYSRRDEFDKDDNTTIWTTTVINGGHEIVQIRRFTTDE